MHTHTHTHTTLGGDVFLSNTIIKHSRRNLNRRRPPEPPSPLGVWLLVALAATCAALTTYLLTK